MMKVPAPGLTLLPELLVQTSQQVQGPQRQSGKKELHEDAHRHASGSKGVRECQEHLSHLLTYEAVDESFCGWRQLVLAGAILKNEGTVHAIVLHDARNSAV